MPTANSGTPGSSFSMSSSSRSGSTMSCDDEQPIDELLDMIRSDDNFVSTTEQTQTLRRPDDVTPMKMSGSLPGSPTTPPMVPGVLGSSTTPITTKKPSTVAMQHPSRLPQPKVHTPRTTKGSPITPITRTSTRRVVSASTSRHGRVHSTKDTLIPAHSPLEGTFQSGIQLPSLSPRTSTPGTKGFVKNSINEDRKPIERLASPSSTTTRSPGSVKEVEVDTKVGITLATTQTPIEQAVEAKTVNATERLEETASPSSPESSQSRLEPCGNKAPSSPLNDSKSVSPKTYMELLHHEFDIDPNECLLSEESDQEEQENEDLIVTTKARDAFTMAIATPVEPKDERESTTTANKADQCVDANAGNRFDSPDSDPTNHANIEPITPREESSSPYDEVPTTPYDEEHMDELESRDLFDMLQASTMKDEFMESAASKEEVWPIVSAEEATVHTRNIKRPLGSKKERVVKKYADVHERTERTDDDPSGQSTDQDDPRPSTKQPKPRNSLWCCCCGLFS